MSEGFSFHCLFLVVETLTQGDANNIHRRPLTMTQAEYLCAQRCKKKEIIIIHQIRSECVCAPFFNEQIVVVVFFIGFVLVA